MTETEIRDSFGRHNPQRVDRALRLLERLRLVWSKKEPTAGRPVTRWSATKATKASEQTLAVATSKAG